MGDHVGIPSVVRFAFCPGGALDGGVPLCAAESLLFARRETSSGHFYLPARVPRPWDPKTVGSPPGVLGPVLPWSGDSGVGRGPIDTEVGRLIERGEAAPTLSKLRKSVDG